MIISQSTLIVFNRWLSRDDVNSIVTFFIKTGLWEDRPVTLNPQQKKTIEQVALNMLHK